MSPTMLTTLTHTVNKILASTSHKPYIADFRACISNSNPTKSPVYGFWPLDSCSPLILLPMTQLFWHFSTHTLEDIATVEFDSQYPGSYGVPIVQLLCFLGNSSLPCIKTIAVLLSLETSWLMDKPKEFHPHWTLLTIHAETHNSFLTFPFYKLI